MVVITAEVLGTKEIGRALRALPQKTRNRVFRSVMPKAGRLVAKAGKKTAPKQSGVLAKSLGTRAYTSVDAVGAVVGPRSKVGKYVVDDTHKGKRVTRVATSAAGIRALGRGSADSADLVFRRPIKYAHLTELGTKTIAARHWLRKAHLRTRSQTRSTIRIGTRNAVERETRKLSATTKK